VKEQGLARDMLWEVSENQHGFITTRQAADLGVSRQAVVMLARRGTLDRAAWGVYRFPQYPVSEFDPFMLAVLWTGCRDACLSHETALDAYQISDINPNTVHVTVPKSCRIRRANGEGYVVHHENLDRADIGWWQEIPTVTAAVAIGQCIDYGTPTYLLRQALERERQSGYLTTAQQDRLAESLEKRHAN
jgi:predicted transcriptional regulator of viral defense system